MWSSGRRGMESESESQAEKHAHLTRKATAEHEEVVTISQGGPSSGAG